MTPAQRNALIDSLFAQAQADLPDAPASVLFARVRVELHLRHGLVVSGSEVARALVAEAGFAE